MPPCPEHWQRPGPNTRWAWCIAQLVVFPMRCLQHSRQWSLSVVQNVRYLQECASVSDPTEVERLCDEAMDAAKFLREMIVQAKLNERGNYGAV